MTSGRGGIDHADQPDKDQVLFQEVGLILVEIVGHIAFQAVCDSQNPQGVLRHGVVGCQNLAALAGCQRAGDVLRGLILRAKAQHHVGSALDRDHIPLRWRLVVEGRGVLGLRMLDVVNRDHPLAFGVEGHLVLTGVGLLQLHVIGSGFGRRHEQRAFRGITDNPIRLFAVLQVDGFQFGVVVQHADPQGGQRRGVVGDRRQLCPPA